MALNDRVFLEWNLPQRNLSAVATFRGEVRAALGQPHPRHARAT